MRRGKMGFGMPLATWFRRELKPMSFDLLGPSARVHDLLQRSTTRETLERHMAGEDRSAPGKRRRCKPPARESRP